MRASKRRVDQLAVKILDEAAIQARDGPIARTDAHRLALAWLSVSGAVPPRDTKMFWDFLAHQGIYAGDKGKDFRSVHPPCFIKVWKRTIGMTAEERQ